MTALQLWLTRHLGDPVALVAAPTRAAAIDTAHASIAAEAKGDMTAVLVGHALHHRAPGIVADLRVKFAVDVPEDDTRIRDTKHLGGDMAARRAVRAVAEAMDLPLQAILENQARRPTAIRHQIWRTLRGRKMALSAIAAVTGHNLAAVSFALTKEPASPPAETADMLAKVHEMMVAELDRA